MEHFRIQLYSTGHLGGILDIGYTAEQSSIVSDLLYVFGAEFDAANQKIKLEYKHKYTKELQELLDKYTTKYKSVLPQIQQLTGKFKKLNEGEWFFLLPPIEFTTKQKYELEKELNQLNKLNSDISEEQIQQLFGCIMGNYEFVTFNLDKDKKIKIGENKKNNRVCRFCGSKSPDVSFRKEAHAISEALGNKKLILNEECDSCNEFFDANIERDFIYYHDLARTMFGVKNKENNTPKLKGKNFDFFNDDSGGMSIAIVANDENHAADDGPPKSIVFKTGNTIKIQNIYKALCKFALSVIDSKHINNFNNTIKWLKNDIEASSLPKIAVLNSYSFFTKRPEIILYVRNNDNEKLPYLVGEFRFTFYLYIFIVPFCNNDKNEFISEDEYDVFLDCFKHVKMKQGFSFVDFSQNIDRELNFNIKFKKQD